MHIYFMGVCGTAMGNAALMLAGQGHRVSGSDSGVYPPMSDKLREGGIAILEGYDAERLEQLGPDLVVVGNAVSRGNPEVEWLLDTRALPFISLPALLGEQVIGERPALVVAGTHGKTTTSTLAAYLLEKNNANPGWLIGGVPRDLPEGARFGHPTAPFVIEGDEYDSAFFDKRSKFIHYRPRVLALNNLEFDHGDIFRDLADISRSFSHLLRIVPCGGAVAYNGDDPNLAALLPVSWCPCVSVGVGEHCDLRISDFAEGPEGSRFSLVWKGEARKEIAWSLPGLYNARNAAVAALSAGLLLDGENPLAAIDLAPLAEFQGVKRRQEMLLKTDALVVVEDFGHHPTAIAGTLESLRARFPEHRLTACFEPRSNTATTNVFQGAFTEALARADAVYLGPVHRAEKIPADERLDTTAMAEILNADGCCAGAFPSHEALLEDLVAATRNKTDATRPRCVVFFSNGSFGGIMPKYVAAVS